MLAMYKPDISQVLRESGRDVLLSETRLTHQDPLDLERNQLLASHLRNRALLSDCDPGVKGAHHCAASLPISSLSPRFTDCSSILETPGPTLSVYDPGFISTQLSSPPPTASTYIHRKQLRRLWEHFRPTWICLFKIKLTFSSTVRDLSS